MTSVERVLVTGAIRGIGIGREYIKRGDVHVFATCRDVERADELRAIQQSAPEALTVVKLDLGEADSIERACNVAAEAVVGLDVLINNAAMRFPN